MPNPLDNPELYDFILLGSPPQQSPGLADVAGAGSPRKWDEKKGYGTSGASITYTGDGLAKFSVKLHLLTSQDWADWQTFRVLVAKTPEGTKPSALPISHPYLEELGITSVVVEDLLQPAPVGDEGEYVVEIKFIQYRAPKPSVGKPTGAAGGAAKEAPKDELDKTIDALTSQVQELAK